MGAIQGIFSPPSSDDTLRARRTPPRGLQRDHRGVHAVAHAARRRKRHGLMYANCSDHGTARCVRLVGGLPRRHEARLRGVLRERPQRKRSPDLDRLNSKAPTTARSSTEELREMRESEMAGREPSSANFAPKTTDQPQQPITYVWIRRIIRLIRQQSDALRTQVLKMSKQIRHRGPDWSGIYCGERAILFSHERLLDRRPPVGPATPLQPRRKARPGRQRGDYNHQGDPRRTGRRVRISDRIRL